VLAARPRSLRSRTIPRTLTGNRSVLSPLPPAPSASFSSSIKLLAGEVASARNEPDALHELVSASSRASISRYNKLLASVDLISADAIGVPFACRSRIPERSFERSNFLLASLRCVEISKRVQRLDGETSLEFRGRFRSNPPPISRYGLARLARPLVALIIRAEIIARPPIGGYR